MTKLIYPCENCHTTVVRDVGDEGRGRFCSSKCARAAQPFPTRDERFWAKVAKGDGCWEWQGHRNAAHYGLLYSGPRGASRQAFAHRVSWEINVGPIPEGAFVLHHCDNPPCVRPDHLFLGTTADNMHDRDAKGRGRSLGVHTKITRAQAEEIRSRAAGGAVFRVLAAEYNLTRSSIGRIVNGRRWK